MRGVILAGGHGKRLDPLTRVTNKHLLPIYKKPMIFYPIETLVKCGIKDILIVTSGEHLGHYFRLLGTGKAWGITLHYEIQDNSDGTGVALLCAEEFANKEDIIVVLGDNIVVDNLSTFVEDFHTHRDIYDAKILIAKVDDPCKYGVVCFEGDRITKLVEKPLEPFSDYVNTGLWIFKANIFENCKTLKRSVRGEYEITDVLAQYAADGKLTYGILKSPWTDAGSFEQLYQATLLMRELEARGHSVDPLVPAGLADPAGLAEPAEISRPTPIEIA